LSSYRKKSVFNFTKDIARFAVDIEYAALPGEIIRQAKFCIMDTFGSIIASLKMGFKSGKLIANHMRKLGGRNEATIFGFQVRVPYLSAAFANSALQCDLDGFHLQSGCHIASLTVPAALCIAEKEHKSGKNLIEALVIGYDVMARIGMATNPFALYERGFHSTSVCGPFGCAAAGGKLLNLNADQMINALGLAGVQGAGLTNWQGGHLSVFFQAAKAAQSGVLAASLAQAGLAGSTNILDDERGVCRTFSNKTDLKKLTEDLGKRFEIMRMSIKRYACCAHMHSGIDALIEVLKENQLASGDIEDIMLIVPSSVVSLLNSCETPLSPLAALMNGRYILSTTARIGEAMQYNVEAFLGDGRKDPRNYELLNRIDIAGDPCSGIGEAVVRVKTKEGTKYVRHKRSAKGTPRQPLTGQELEDKFRKLTSYFPDKQTTDQIVRRINHLERVEDINDLTEILVKTVTDS